MFSGTYRGKNEVLEKLLGQLQSPGRTIIDNIVAEGDHVVVQGRAVDRTTTSGKSYDNTYCWVMRLVDGEIVQVDEYCDTELVTAVFGK